MCAEHPGDLHRDGVWRRLHIHLDQLLRPEHQVKTSLGSDLTGVVSGFHGFCLGQHRRESGVLLHHLHPGAHE